jgi:hypothetical protein
MTPADNAIIATIEVPKPSVSPKEQMGSLDFIASVLSSIVWPLLIIVVFIALRRHIDTIFTRINELSFKDVSLKFDNALDDARQNGVKALQEQNSTPPIHQIAADDPIVLRAQSDPQTFIVSSFVLIDRALASLYRIAHREGEFKNGAEFIEELKTKNVVSENAYLWFVKLQRLRNLAEHSSSERLGTSISVIYRLQCLTFVHYLEGLEPRVKSLFATNAT